LSSIPKSWLRSMAMIACSSSRDGLATRISSPWMVACAFLKPPLDHAGLEHVDQGVHPELVIGRQPDLGLGTIELDGAVGALEVVALRDLLQRLVDGVVHFLQIGAGGDIE
jgi:hypothetical protein